MDQQVASRMNVTIALALMMTLAMMASLIVVTAHHTRNAIAALKISSLSIEKAVKYLDAPQKIAKLPLIFEPNRGQADRAAQFVARTSGADAYLAPTSATFVLKGEAQSARRRPYLDHSHKINSKQALTSAFSMQIRGGNPQASSAGLNELSGKTNYIIGSRQWLTGIPNYARVQFSNVYPGIDLVYYGNQQQLEYDFIVSPGADPSTIRLGFDGVESLQLNPQGDLLIRVAGREVTQKKPYLYQQINGRKAEVRGSYALLDKKEVAFRVDRYDRRVSLVIDPVLVYSTYLGGSGWDGANGIAVDASGSAYVVGSTTSLNFPTALPSQFSEHGGYDGFVAKVKPDGSGLVYSTYFGGSGDDYLNGIALDQSGNAYAVGTTSSSDLPVLGGVQSNYGGGIFDAFVVKLNQDGSIKYSTYLGGSQEDDGMAIAVDSSGSVYATGFTASSADFPLSHALQPAFGGGAYDAFVAKINPAGSSLVYSTFLGGSQEDDGLAIAIDSLGNAYLAGISASPELAKAGAVQTVYGGGTSDAFAAKINAAGSALVYSTFLGGSGADAAFAIAVDASGSAFIAGNTSSTNFPVSASAFQANNAGGFNDAFVAKLSPSGSALAFSTYLGGSNAETANGIALDAAGNVYVAGNTGSLDFPVVNSVKSFGGSTDAFVSKLSPSGNALAFSTFLGGTLDDSAAAIAVDASGNAYVTGNTGSLDFPVLRAFQRMSAGGGSDAFIAKLGSRLPSVSSLVTSSGPISGGTVVSLKGTNFLPGATVSFGGVPATAVVVSNLGAISAVAGGHSAGAVDVTVTNADGQSATLAAAFTFMGPPAISSISPNTGAIGGGTRISVSGSNFAPGAVLTLDGLAATNIVVSGGTISADAPAHSAGAVDVVVTNPDGQSGTLVGGFSYVGLPSFSDTLAPQVGGLDPASGPVDGGTTVVITGANFSNGLQVTFDGAPVASVSVIDSNTLSVMTPAHAAGAVDIRVVNPNGKQALVAAGYEFTSPSGSDPALSQPKAMGCNSTGAAPNVSLVLMALALLTTYRRPNRKA